jgi:hypothetical protein
VSDVAVNLAALHRRIDAACARAGRDRAGVILVAVSKRQPVTAIAEAATAGHRDFGENYAQELREKIAGLDLADARWHFIGRLQRNKVKLVVGEVALIHAVDSARLLEAIDRAAGERGVVQAILVAVNVAGEQSKSGVDPGEARELVEAAAALEHVECRGLMTMPPWPEEPEDSRGFFRELRELRDRLSTPAAPLPELSMGTTGDLEVALEEGATLIRVGTAVFGPRS